MAAFSGGGMRRDRAKGMRMRRGVSVDCFDEEGNGAEAVVATDHRAMGISHPAVEEVAFATSQCLDKFAHCLPCRSAKAVGTLSVG